MTDLRISAGVDVLLVNGTFGECTSLTKAEHGVSNETVVAMVRRRLPVFARIGMLNTSKHFGALVATKPFLWMRRVMLWPTVRNAY